MGLKRPTYLRSQSASVLVLVVHVAQRSTNPERQRPLAFCPNYPDHKNQREWAELRESWRRNFSRRSVWARGCRTKEVWARLYLSINFRAIAAFVLARVTSLRA